MKRYNTYSSHLKEKYGEKTYKIPVNLPVSCPNRDGTLGNRGCIFCGDVATGFESLDSSLSVKEQLLKNIDYIGKKYNAKKFIAYFQNFTNTYMEFSEFKKSIESALIDGVVEICISTRPDCIPEIQLNFLKTLSDERKINISIELGLQSINPNTLRIIQRGHGFSEFLSSALKIKSYGFDLCVHMIGNLPWDTYYDFVESAKIFSALKVDYVKIHSLYILKNTVLYDMYVNKEFQIISVEEYVRRVVDFIRYSSPSIIFQRLLARAPEEDAVFCNWGMSWWKISDMIDDYMEDGGYWQGDLFIPSEIKTMNKFGY